MRRVVITGVGIVSPLGNSKEEFFAGLSQGRNGIGPISLFDAREFPVKIAGEVKGLCVEQLCRDNKELVGTKDRKVILGFKAAQDALEDAGITGRECRMMELNLGVSLESVCLEDMAVYVNSVTGPRLQTPLGVLNQLLIQRHRLEVSSFVNCSACVAGTQAIGHSFHRIRAGMADLVLAGGYDSLINPLAIGGFALLGALSTRNDLPEAACRPFDRERDGAVLGEGAAMLVLEALERALARGAKVYGEIVGYGSSMDAYKVTDPHPEGLGAAVAMNGALRDAGLSAAAIDHINAHGTSTPKNDLAETLAIKRVFGKRAYDVPVTAVKSMTGHLIGAAGALEVGASLATFANNQIPPTINLTNPDPACDLNYTPNVATPWKGDMIMKNSFAFGGQNTVLILRRFTC